MRIFIVSVLSSLILLSGCTSKDGISKYDGIMTDEKVEAMERAWCEYNEGKLFVKDQCSKY